MRLKNVTSTVVKQISSSTSMSNTQWGKLWWLPRLRRLLIMGWSTLLLTFMLINIVQAADFAKLDEAIPWAFVAELAPVFDFDGDGCLPSAGISRSGQRNPGLKPGGNITGECRSPNFLDTSNTLHRYACTSESGSTYCGHFYALYFEKDQVTHFLPIGHRHDWEYAAIWTKNGAITHGSYSAHGELRTTTVSNLPFENGHMKVVYHKDERGGGTHALRFAKIDEKAENPYGRFVTPTLISWDVLYGDGLDNRTMRDKLNSFDYGDAIIPCKDSNFLDKLNRFKPPGYPTFSSIWQIFDDFNEPLFGSQWMQSIAGTAIINAGSGTLTLDASAATGPYTYPRYAVVRSTQEFASGAIRFVGIKETNRLWFAGLNNGDGTYMHVRRDQPDNDKLAFAVVANHEVIDLKFFEPPLPSTTIDEITIRWSDDSVDVVVHVDSQTKYTHHVELSEPLAPMPINVGAYTNTRLTIDEVFTSE